VKPVSFSFPFQDGWEALAKVPLAICAKDGGADLGFPAVLDCLREGKIWLVDCGWLGEEISVFGLSVPLSGVCFESASPPLILVFSPSPLLDSSPNPGGARVLMSFRWQVA